MLCDTPAEVFVFIRLSCMKRSHEGRLGKKYMKDLSGLEELARLMQLTQGPSSAASSWHSFAVTHSVAATRPRVTQNSAFLQKPATMDTEERKITRFDLMSKTLLDELKHLMYAHQRPSDKLRHFCAATSNSLKHYSHRLQLRGRSSRASRC